MLFGEGTVFEAGQPCSSQYSASRVTVAVILENLDVIGAPSTVSRRTDKMSGQRVAVKSSKEEFVLPRIVYCVLNIVKLIKGASLWIVHCYWLYYLIVINIYIYMLQ